MTVCNVLQRDCVTRSALELGKKLLPMVKCSGQSCCFMHSEPKKKCRTIPKNILAQTQDGKNSCLEKNTPPHLHSKIKSPKIIIIIKAIYIIIKVTFPESFSLENFQC